MVKALALAVPMLSGQVHAQALEDKAYNAAIGDAASTIGALVLGAAEGNPLGLVTMLIKFPMLAWVKTQPREEQAEYHANWSAVWSGATANNVCLMGAIALTGGALAPFCPMAGLAFGFNQWDKNQPEREFWAICALWKKEFGPQFKCSFTPFTD